MLVTPEGDHQAAPLVVVESGILWNRPGSLRRDGDTLVFETAGRRVQVYVSCKPVEEYDIQTQTPCLALPLNGPVWVSTGRARTRTGSFRRIWSCSGATMW